MGEAAAVKGEDVEWEVEREDGGFSHFNGGNWLWVKEGCWRGGGKSLAGEGQDGMREKRCARSL